MSRLHDVPVTAGVGEGWQRLEHDGGGAVAQRAVHNVRVAGDPADVGDAREDIAWPVVEGVMVRDTS